MVPFLPLLTRGILGIVFRRYMLEQLDEEEKDRQNIRSLILAMMGFSFSGSLALFLVDGKVEASLQLPAYYLLTSFLCYLFVLNLQGHKDFRWEDNILGDGLMEAASLSLIASLLAIVIESKFDIVYKALITTLALATWGYDHIIRVKKLSSFLSSKQ